MGTSLIDRLMAPVRPRPMSSYAPVPERLDEGLWRVERKLRMPGGMVLPVGMTVVRLPSGALFLHAPVALDDDLASALQALGEPSVLFAPNSFHHAFVGEYVRRFPSARLFAAPGLPQRVPALPPATVVSDAPPAQWEGVLEPLPFAPPGPFREVALLHGPTATLVLTDLAFNMRRYEGAFDRFGWRAFGVPAAFGVSRTARWTLLRDAASARPFLARMLEREFRRIVVAHGEPVESDARREFERAFRHYLEP
jgi:hypothetical protein